MPAAASCDTAAIQRNLAFGRQAQRSPGTPDADFCQWLARARRHQRPRSGKRSPKWQAKPQRQLNLRAGRWRMAASTPISAPAPTKELSCPSPSTRLRAGVHYDVVAAHLQAHLFQVTLTIAQPQAQQTVSLPVWIPGSYLVREFAKTCKTCARARASAKSACSRPTSTPWWPIATGKAPLVLTYEVCAYRQLGAHGLARCIARLFNGTSLCLRVYGQEQQPHTLEMPAPAAPTRSLATGLAALRSIKVAIRRSPLRRTGGLPCGNWRLRQFTTACPTTSWWLGLRLL